MNTLIIHAFTLALGACTGAVSAFSLFKQVAIQTSKPSRYVALYPVIRIAAVALMSWHLLRWGPIPFILFGGSMMIAMWIAILTFNE